MSNFDLSWLRFTGPKEEGEDHDIPVKKEASLNILNEEGQEINTENLFVWNKPKVKFEEENENEIPN